MADVELVIKIPEGLKKDFELEQWTALSCMEMKSALKKATQLPKGHGRLIDADKTLATAWANFYVHEDEWEKKDQNYVPLGRFYDQNGFECCQQTIVNAPTIIEADKEDKNE